MPEQFSLALTHFSLSASESASMSWEWWIPPEVVTRKMQGRSWITEWQEIVQDIHATDRWTFGHSFQHTTPKLSRRKSPSSTRGWRRKKRRERRRTLDLSYRSPAQPVKANGGSFHFYADSSIDLAKCNTAFMQFSTVRRETKIVWKCDFDAGILEENGHTGRRWWCWYPL